MNAEKELEKQLGRLIDIYYQECDKELRNDFFSRSIYVRLKTDKLKDKIIKCLNDFSF